MVAMQQQHQDSNVQSNNSTKSDNYVQESIAPSSSSANTNVSSTNNDDSNNKNPSATGNLQSTGSSSTINQSSNYSSNPNPSKNEQKVICTVRLREAKSSIEFIQKKSSRSNQHNKFLRIFKIKSMSMLIKPSLRHRYLHPCHKHLYNSNICYLNLKSIHYINNIPINSMKIFCHLNSNNHNNNHHSIE